MNEFDEFKEIRNIIDQKYKSSIDEIISAQSEVKDIVQEIGCKTCCYKNNIGLLLGCDGVAHSSCYKKK